MGRSVEHKAQPRNFERGKFMRIHKQAVVEILEEHGPAAYAVYSMLCLLADDPVRHPAQTVLIEQKALARKCGCSLASVKRVLDVLEEDHRLAVAERGTRHTANTYCLLHVAETARTELPRATQSKKRSETAQTETSKLLQTAHRELQILENSTKTENCTENKAITPSRKNGAPGAPSPVDPNEVREQIETAFDGWNHDTNICSSAVWTAKADTLVRRELQRFPTLTLDDWGRCIDHRFKSEGINAVEPPERWIPQLTQYLGGPLNRFHQPLTGEENLPLRTRHNLAALKEVHAAIERGEL